MQTRLELLHLVEKLPSEAEAGSILKTILSSKSFFNVSVSVYFFHMCLDIYSVCYLKFGCHIVNQNKKNCVGVMNVNRW